MEVNLQEEFKKAVEPLMDFLKEHTYPFCTVIVKQDRAEILSTSFPIYTRSNDKNEKK